MSTALDAVATVEGERHLSYLNSFYLLPVALNIWTLKPIREYIEMGIGMSMWNRNKQLVLDASSGIRNRRPSIALTRGGWRPRCNVWLTLCFLSIHTNVKLQTGGPPHNMSPSSCGKECAGRTEVNSKALGVSKRRIPAAARAGEKACYVFTSSYISLSCASHRQNSSLMSGRLTG